MIIDRNEDDYVYYKACSLAIYRILYFNDIRNRASLVDAHT